MATTNRDMIFSQRHRTAGGSFSFPNPFFDLASQHIPRNIKDLFRWVEYIYLANSTVSQCIKRTISYPITEVQIANEDEKESEALEELLVKDLDLKKQLKLIGVDYFVYGNSFVSVLAPFDRLGKCQSCSAVRPINKFKKLKFKKPGFFEGECFCGHKGKVPFRDVRSFDPKRAVIKRWDPKQVDISYNEITGESTYYYTLTPKTVQRIQKGDGEFCSAVPIEFLKAAFSKGVIKLKKEMLLHLRTESLAGLSQEWGIPPVFCTFKLHFHNAVLRKANEAICMDYLTPIRFYFPQTQGNNPLDTNLKKFRDFVQEAIKKHRRDPGAAYFSPYPVGYQALGGEAKALNLTAEIKMTTEEIMNAMGFPQEFFYGSITVQAAPVALRLLENTMSGWVGAMNQATQWIADKIFVYFRKPKCSVGVAKPTLVDDIERKTILLQLLQAQKVADDTILKALGTSHTEESKKLFKEQKHSAEQQIKLQREVQEAQKATSDAQGFGVSVTDIEGQAEQLAQQWLSMDYASRRQAMEATAKENTTLYSVAKEIMTRLRNQQGHQQVEAQPQQAPEAAAA